MKSLYDGRLDRARTLIEQQPASADLLRFYLEIAALQKLIFEAVVATDVSGLLRWFPDLLGVVSRFAPELAAFAGRDLAVDAARLEVLAARWEAKSEIDPRAGFFANALLQPFASNLAQRGQVDPHWTDPSCPFCGSPPGLAILRSEGDGGKRSLLCSLCSTEWTFRRILCPNCGEEDKTKLPVYIPDGAEHVRIEACDTCRTYLKSVDLTKNGLADPVVDEIATVPLNIWAEEHGYVKLAPNVMGM